MIPVIQNFGNVKFLAPFFCLLNAGDTVQVVIQDDLSSIDVFEMSLKLWSN